MGSIRELPPPARAEGTTLWQAITSRRSRREFGRRPLRDEELSALLWSGQGITSPEGGRAAPSPSIKASHRLRRVQVPRSAGAPPPP